MEAIRVRSKREARRTVDCTTGLEQLSGRTEGPRASRKQQKSFSTVHGQKFFATIKTRAVIENMILFGRYRSLGSPPCVIGFRFRQTSQVSQE
jgi:hypothetical protein